MTAYPPDRWARIDALFGEALDRPPSEREAFLEAACAGDPELLEAVRALLANEAGAARLIGESAMDFDPDLIESLDGEDEASDPDMPGRVGPYRVVAELGRGGMGTVYLGERADGEFEKRVALKLIRRGLDTDDILRRFSVERRILASLEHPNIARLYDGGATEDGRPYLVMELVEGEKITDYCAARRLPLERRLELFRSVCAAVQHAHQRLVVHRDIKPSNILVTADGSPRLLDFGIAKLVADDADGPHTRTGMRVLTPEYAAPEQVRGDPVTTASDVYSLGAVLHELLTGRRPPHRPDTGRDRTLPRDLETIVRKALEPEVPLRYPSVQQLMEDLDRFREGRPVLARPAAFGYRAGKFVRRHRLALASGAVVLLSMAGGLGAALSQAEAAERARALAEDERAAAEEVTAFLEGLFGAADPFSARPGRLDTMRIGSFLERGAERIGDQLGDRPAVRARILGVLGRAYDGLGDLDRAERLLEESLETYRSVHGDAHADVATAMNSLGNLHLARGRPDAAAALHRQALDIRRDLFGPDHLDVAQSLGNLASALQDAGHLDEAEPLYDELLDIHRRLPAPDSATFADVLNARMVLAFRKDDLDRALPIAREILDINRALFGDEHPRVAQSMNNLAQLLARTGDLEQAEPLLRSSLAMNRTILGGAHPDIAAGAANLAGTLLKLGRADEAEPLYLEAIAMNRSLLGDQHPGLAVSLSNYADLLAERGSDAEAELLQREALAINQAAFGTTHPSVGIVSARLAGTLCRQGRIDAGRELFREALTTLRATLPAEHSAIVSAEAAAGRCD